MAATMPRATGPVDPVINDHMTRVQLRLMKEKLDEEARNNATSSSTSQGYDMDQDAVRLHQAMLRRKELMERIKEEQRLKDGLLPARSHSEQRHPRASVSPSPSRQSLPDMRHQQMKPSRLEPLQPTQAQQGSPRVYQTTVPQPVVIGDGLTQRVNTKAEMMELMMMQNAQMHQMMMQQLMMSNMPKNNSTNSDGKLTVDLEDIITLKSDKKAGVHHHHYNTPPPGATGPQQQQQQSQTLPPYHLPPIYPQTIPPYVSPRYPYPYETEPLRPPREYPSHLHHHYDRHNRHTRRNRESSDEEDYE